MQIKIGQIYKVKPEFINSVYFAPAPVHYIRYLDLNPPEIEFLDKNKKTFHLTNIGNCFKPEHLEPLEKTLYNLETNDFIEDRYGNKRKVLGLIESSPENPLYVLSYSTDFELVNGIYSTKYLEKNSLKVFQPEPTEEIKEMTVEEVSKLVGKKVKIVE